MERSPFSSSEADSSGEKEESRKKKKTTRIPKKALESIDVHKDLSDSKRHERLVRPTQNIIESMMAIETKAEKAKDEDSEKDTDAEIEEHDTTDAEARTAEKAPKDDKEALRPLDKEVALSAGEADPNEGNIEKEGEIKLGESVLEKGKEVDDSHEDEPQGVIEDEDQVAEVSITEDEAEPAVEATEPADTETTAEMDEEDEEEDPLAVTSGTGSAGGSSGSGSSGSGSGASGSGTGSGGSGSGSGGGSSGGGAGIYGYHHFVPPTPGMSPTAFERALEDAEYRGRKSGKRSGALAWFTAGWLVGRHGKKKAAKEHAAEMKARDKEVKELTDEQWLAHERIEAIKRNQENIEANLHKPKAVNEAPVAAAAMVVKNEAKPAANIAHHKPEATPTAPRTETPKVEKDAKAARAFEFPPLPVGLEKDVPVSAKAEKLSRRETERIIRSQEKLAKELGKEAIEELSPEDKAITEKMYATSEGRRVNLSSWHRMEVDAKTGRLVENPDVGYGQEFIRERKEVFKDNRFDGPSGGGGGDGGGSGGAFAAQQLGQVGVSKVASDDELRSRAESAGLIVPPLEKSDDMFQPSWSAKPTPMRYLSSPLVWTVGIVITGAVLLFIFL